MIVLGDISGIQNYLFDVSDAGGGQARRLRARSFYIQLLAEAAALRVLRVLSWLCDEHHFVLSGAGKFLLRGAPGSQASDRLRHLGIELSDWLLRETRGELRIALAWADGESDVATYRAAMAALQREKFRSWAPAGAGWEPSRLVLPPLSRPCDLCRHATAAASETDDETGEVREVCARCAEDRDIGRALPRARWLFFHKSPRDGEQNVFALGAGVSASERVVAGPDTVAVMNLVDADRRPEWCPADKFVRRRLMAHVPADPDGRPVWFVELAHRARGDRLLGVLKADADSLGVVFEHLLSNGNDLRPMADFSRELDQFFTDTLQREIKFGADSRWQSIYTVFAGGDDLLLVGPWDVMFEFAGRMRELFKQQFGGCGLTLSAGIALTKPKRPIKAVVAEAERLLERAKVGTKDQVAAFGQCWKWHHHSKITANARQLVQWVEAGKARRGWLHTLLELAQSRQGEKDREVPAEPLATPRLAWHVDRNYRDSAVRRWGEQLVERFDRLEDPEINFLPATLRYALTATRSPGEED